MTGQILTLGLGSFSNVNFLPTLGLGTYDTEDGLLRRHVQARRRRTEIEDREIALVLRLVAPYLTRQESQKILIDLSTVEDDEL